MVRTGQGNDFELIPMIKMENRHPVEGSFGSEFPATYNHCRLMAAWSRKKSKNFWETFFVEKRPIIVKFSKISFQKFPSWHGSTCCVQISWNLADMKLAKSGTAYVTAVATGQICHGQAPTMCLVLQMSSKLVDFRQSYSRTYEHCQNVP